MTSVLIVLVVGFSLSTELTDATTVGCPGQYTWNGVLQRCILIQSTIANKTEAVQQCGGKDLLHIYTQEQNEEVKRLIRVIKREEYGMWLGLHRYPQGWNWVNKSTPSIVYFNWFQGYPLSYYDRTDVFMGGGGQWFNDVPRVRRAFICQHSPPATVCLSGWTFIETSCFHVAPVTEMFTSAKQYCKRKGGYLAEPTSADMNNRLYALLKDGAKGGASALPFAYIGVVRGSSGSGFRFLNSEKSLSFSNWATGAPPPPGKGDCVVQDITTKGKWTTTNCSTQNYILCQQDYQPTCGANETSIGSRCYQLHNDRRSFSEANHFCQQRVGRKLAEPTNSDLNTRIFSLLTQESPGNMRAYIGLRKLSQSHQFQLQGSYLAPNYTAWITDPGATTSDALPYCAWYNQLEEWDYILCSRREMFMCQEETIVCPPVTGKYGDRDLNHGLQGTTQTLQCHSGYAMSGDPTYVCQGTGSNSSVGQWIGTGTCRRVIPELCYRHGFVFSQPLAGGAKTNFSLATAECKKIGAGLPRLPPSDIVDRLRLARLDPMDRVRRFGLDDPHSRMSCLVHALEYYRISSTILDTGLVFSTAINDTVPLSGGNHYLCEYRGSYTCKSYGVVLHKPMNWERRPRRPANLTTAQADCARYGMTLPLEGDRQGKDGLRLCQQSALRFFGLQTTLIDRAPGSMITYYFVGSDSLSYQGYDLSFEAQYLCQKNYSYGQASSEELKASFNCFNEHQLYQPKGYWTYSEAVTRCEATGGDLIHEDRLYCAKYYAYHHDTWMKASSPSSNKTNMDSDPMLPTARLQVLCERLHEPRHYLCSPGVRMVLLSDFSRTAPYRTAELSCRDYTNGYLPSLDDMQCGAEALKFFNVDYSLTASNAANVHAITNPYRPHTPVHHSKSVASTFLCKTGSGPCPNGWTLIEDQCFRVFTQAKTYVDAQSFCQSTFGGNLAVPAHRYMNKGIFSMLVTPSNTQPKGVYIGLMRAANTNDFLQAGTNKRAFFTAWQTNEPSGAIGIDHCAWFNVAQDKWAATPCSVQTFFICQVEAQFTDQYVQSGICSNGWTVIENTCVKVYDEKMDYSSAEYFCKRQSANIAVPSNADMNQRIHALIPPPVYGLHAVHIGLKRAANTNDFLMAGTSYTSTFTNWNTNEPNGLIGADNCARYHWDKPTWDDAGCDQPLRFICQRYAPIRDQYVPLRDTLHSCSDVHELYIPYTSAPRVYKQAVADCHATGGNLVHWTRISCIQQSHRLRGNSYWVLAESISSPVQDSGGVTHTRYDRVRVVCERIRGSYGCPLLPSGYKLAVVPFPKGNSVLRREYATRKGVCESHGMELPTKNLAFKYSPCEHPAIRARSATVGLTFREELTTNYDGSKYGDKQEAILCQEFTNYTSFAGDADIIRICTVNMRRYSVILPKNQPAPSTLYSATKRCQDLDAYLPTSEQKHCINSLKNTATYPFGSIWDLRGTTHADTRYFVCIKEDQSPRQYICPSGKVKFVGSNGTTTGTKHVYALDYCRNHASGILPDYDMAKPCLQSALKMFDMQETWVRYYKNQNSKIMTLDGSLASQKAKSLKTYLCQTGVSKQDRVHLQSVMPCGNGDEIYIPYGTGQMTYNEADIRCHQTGGHLPHWSRIDCLRNAVANTAHPKSAFWAMARSATARKADGSDSAQHNKNEYLHVLCERVAAQPEYFCRDMKRKFVGLERLGVNTAHYTLQQAQQKCQTYANAKIPDYTSSQSDFEYLNCLRLAMDHFGLAKIFSQTQFNHDHVRGYRFLSGQYLPDDTFRVGKAFAHTFLCEAEITPEDVMLSSGGRFNKTNQPPPSMESAEHFYHSTSGKSCTAAGGTMNGSLCFRNDLNCDLVNNGYCFRFFKTRRNWGQAQRICERWGGHLVRTNEEDLAKQLLQKSKVIDKSAVNYWVQLHWPQNMYKWYWLTSFVYPDLRADKVLSPPHFPWAQGQPGGGQCAISGGTDATLKSATCASTYNFWCMRDAYSALSYKPTASDEAEWSLNRLYL